MRPNKNHPIAIEFGKDIKSMSQRAKLAQHLPRLGEWEEIGKWKLWNYYSSKFELPYDFQIMKDFESYAKEVLIPAGWEWDRDRDFNHIWGEQEAAIIYHFTKQLPDYREITFDVRFSSTIDGATCVINTLMKPESKDGVFEVICEDGAEEILNG